MCLQLGIFVKNSVLRSTLFHYLRLFTLLLSQLRLCLVMLTLSNVSLAKKKKKKKSASNPSWFYFCISQQVLIK